MIVSGSRILVVLQGHVVVPLLLLPLFLRPLLARPARLAVALGGALLVAALGIGLAETIPGRSPLLDGFGLIAFASLFPIISVLAYGQLAVLRERASKMNKEEQNAL